MKKFDIAVIIFIIIVSVFALKNLFGPGYYSSHDGVHQVIRLYYFDQLISDRQIPPRWVGDLLNGYGYPLFNFSYHLPWIIAEPFVLFGGSIFDAINITFVIAFSLSGITMYIFLRHIFGLLPAFVGAFL